jgi:hypothetical protein
MHGAHKPGEDMRNAHKGDCTAWRDADKKERRHQLRRRSLAVRHRLDTEQVPQLGAALQLRPGSVNGSCGSNSMEMVIHH